MGLVEAGIDSMLLLSAGPLWCEVPFVGRFFDFFLTPLHPGPAQVAEALLSTTPDLCSPVISTPLYLFFSASVSDCGIIPLLLDEECVKRGAGRPLSFRVVPYLLLCGVTWGRTSGCHRRPAKQEWDHE